MFHLTAIQHLDPSRSSSFLEDLIVTKARNLYRRPVNGKIELVDGEDGSPRLCYKYCFRFFHISTEHVNKINCVIFEQPLNISTIAFKSQPGARKVLEYYLGMPCELGKMYNFETVTDDPNDPRRVCLRKLEHAAKQLGSNAIAVYQEQLSKVEEFGRFEFLGGLLESRLPKNPSKSMKLYMKLG